MAVFIFATALDLGSRTKPEVGNGMGNHPMTITVTCACRGQVACMCIAGDVDLMDPVDLSQAQRQLASVTCETLFVDLAGVTFGGAALVHYLYALAARLPGAATWLCGSSGMTATIIKLTGLDQVATLRDGLPKDWATAPASTSNSEWRLPTGHPALGTTQPVAT